MELIVFDQRRRFTNFYLNLLKHFVKRKKSCFRGVCNSCKANPQLKLLCSLQKCLGFITKGISLTELLRKKNGQSCKNLVIIMVFKVTPFAHTWLEKISETTRDIVWQYLEKMLKKSCP